MIRPEFNLPRHSEWKMAAGNSSPSLERRQVINSSKEKGHYFGGRQTNQFVESYSQEDTGLYSMKQTMFPQAKQQIHKEHHGSFSTDPNFHEVDMSAELREISKRLEMCRRDFTSNYMKKVIRDIDVHKSSDTAQLIALKELFQQLEKEMAHLSDVLSYLNQLRWFSSGGMVEKAFGNVAHSTSASTSFHSYNHLATDDLVHLRGPLTESILISTLYRDRFMSQRYHSRIGPVLLVLNPFGSATKKDEDFYQKENNSSVLREFVGQSLQQLFDTHTSQVFILSGECGSGKSFTAQLLIQHLLHLTCGGLQTDLAKQLVASVTVLQSLGKARTSDNGDSSRMATLYGIHFCQGIISKAKIRCYPLDLSRIVGCRKSERNFHIFYQLFAGLSPKDRAKLQLQTHSANELRYLYNYPEDNQSEIEALRERFQSWKLALSVLGIPFADVSRILAAILLMGNVQFTEKSARVLEVQGGDYELKAVAVLLGVAYTSLFRGLTKRSKLIRGEIAVQPCTAAQANSSRDALSKALYFRMLSAIVRRCNCSRKPASSLDSSPNSSSESLSKDHTGACMSLAPMHATVIDINNNNNDDDEMVGIADLFGFENSECNSMEQMCSNLCSETIQHFYTTHIFKSAEEYCREEGLENVVDVDYADNSLCIELLTCQETGILNYLDRNTLDSSSNDPPEEFLENLRRKHGGHTKFFTTDCDRLEFSVRHHSGEVVYNAKDLLRSNDDSIADDVIRMFSKQHCNFGFVTHLFSTDLKSKPSPETVHEDYFLHQVSQGSGVAATPSERYSKTFFLSMWPLLFQQAKLDGILQTLVQAQPWFILCIKSNDTGKEDVFDRQVVARQAKALQVFETVYLLRSGYTHRMRILQFAQRYFAFHDDQLTQDEALDIVRSYERVVAEARTENPNKILYVGRKHVFFSELIWQDLERDRNDKILIAEQSRRKQFANESSPLLRERTVSGQLDIDSVLSPELMRRSHAPAHTDVSTPPPVPKRRGYTVIDNKKIAFPQTRVMKQDYRDAINGEEVVFYCGETVRVTGASPKAGLLSVKTKDKIGWVPLKLTELLGDSG